MQYQSNDEPVILGTPTPFQARYEKNIGPVEIYSILPHEPQPRLLITYIGRNEKDEVAPESFPPLLLTPYPVWAFYPLLED
ncbi:hypothetical protein RSOLAG22IIIB_11881 [Rhizoctonia solani]|uniref:Uncharacterized protein n=1 Tax=Rhizoctonia solani TaxID=456999 RepID=A0A0K6GAY6_9AGAM|nr:hypothetical protein RSOLAG22IIIB_11881 [Rhizoctonia solani]